MFRIPGGQRRLISDDLAFFMTEHDWRVRTDLLTCHVPKILVKDRCKGIHVN